MYVRSAFIAWFLCPFYKRLSQVAPGDEEVHYTRQGNADYYTADALAMREALVYDKDIQATLSMFWHVVSGAEGKLIYWPQYVLRTKLAH